MAKQYSKKAFMEGRKAGLEKDKAKNLAKGMFRPDDADDAADDEDLEKADCMEPDGDEDLEKGEKALQEALDLVKGEEGRITSEQLALVAKKYDDKVDKLVAAADALIKADHVRKGNQEKAILRVGDMIPDLVGAIKGLRDVLKAVSSDVALVKGEVSGLNDLVKGGLPALDLNKGDKADLVGAPVSGLKAKDSVAAPVPSPNEPAADTVKVTVGSFMKTTDALLKGDTLSADDYDTVVTARAAVQSSGMQATDALAAIKHLLPAA